MGFTDVGLLRISKSVRAYAYLILSSQASSIVLGGSSAFFQKMEIYILFLNIWIQSAFKDNSGYHLMVPI